MNPTRIGMDHFGVLRLESLQEFPALNSVRDRNTHSYDKDEEQEGPLSAKKQRTVNDQKPAHGPHSLLTDLADKRQTERTNEIVDIIERENLQGNKEVLEVGKKFFEEKLFKS
eukprot:Seg2833.5 transcript_id=Seg2833.5/GoldUCD/mRNA.D3Y31 product="hypothetical protein" protein_id=Seg2833.5/GoldUCD/D3Y31